MLRRVAAGALVGLLALAAGCSGGRKIVPVSGVVKYNGEPAKNVVVSFQPLGDKSDENPGRGSSAYTDDNGHFTLIYDGEKPGALTGKHRIRISPQWNTSGATATLNYPIPPEWHDLSKKEYEVPEGGTDQANFDIEGPPAKK